MNHCVLCKGQDAPAKARAVVRRIGPRDLPMRILTEQPQETILFRNQLLDDHATYRDFEDQNVVISSGMFL